MTPDEALWAATAGGARALRRDDVGTLAVGARADLVLLDAPSPLHLAYRPGVPLVSRVWRSGSLVVTPDQESESRERSRARPAHRPPRPVRAHAPGRRRRRPRRRPRRARPRRRSPPCARSAARVAELAASPTPAYGISTGFGALATRHISPDLRVQLQRSLVRSHAAGLGDPVETEVVRALVLLRLKTLASGRTGVRPVVVETLAALLNAGITPVVREYGSLGCSGDLAPLAHCALVLMGEGEAAGPDGVVRPGARAARRGGHRAGGAAGQGGARAHQRHRRDARDAAAGLRRPAHAARHRRRHRRDVARGAARHRPGAAARAARRPAAAPGAGGQRRRDAAPAGGLAAGRLPPRGRHPGAGRVLAALRPAGPRRGPRHARPRAARRERASWRRRSTTRWCWRTGGCGPTATSTGRRSRTSSTSWPWSARTSPRWPSGGPTGCSTRRARTGCRRSSRTTRASTAG